MSKWSGPPNPNEKADANTEEEEDLNEMDLGTNNNIVEAIDFRKKNCGLIEKLINTKALDSLLVDFNKDNFACAIYGDWAWNFNFVKFMSQNNPDKILQNIFGETPSPLERLLLETSYAKGSLDVVIVPKMRLDTTTFQSILKRIDIIWRSIESSYNTFLKKNDAALRHLLSPGGVFMYELKNPNTSLTDQYRKLVCGASYEVYLELKDEFELSNLPTRIGIFSVEIGTFPVDIDEFKKKIVLLPSGIMTSKGLFFAQHFTKQSKKLENQIDLNSMRDKMLTIMLKESFLEDGVKHKNIVDLFMSDLKTIFIEPSPNSKAKSFYASRQAEAMLRLFDKFDATVASSSAASASPQQSFKEYFDSITSSIILDSPGGGNGNQDLPSLRQILNWIIILLEQTASADEWVEGAGGDAIRRYLYDLIKLTADIDSKYFFSGTFPEQRKNKIVAILTMLNDFFKTQNYFRFTETRDVRFGSEEFTIKFDTRNQEVITSVRILLDWIVRGIISVDGKLKFSIISKETDDKISSVASTAPFDCVFIKKTQPEINIKKANNRRVLNRDDLAILFKKNITQYTFTGVDVRDQQGSFELTPEPSFADVLFDVKQLIENETLRANRPVHKREKDKIRLAGLESLERAVLQDPNKPYIPRITYVTLDQFIPILKTSALKENIDFLIGSMRLILSSDINLAKRYVINASFEVEDTWTPLIDSLGVKFKFQPNIVERFLNIGSTVVNKAGRRKKSTTPFSNAGLSKFENDSQSVNQNYRMELTEFAAKQKERSGRSRTPTNIFRPSSSEQSSSARSSAPLRERPPQQMFSAPPRSSAQQMSSALPPFLRAPISRAPISREPISREPISLKRSRDEKEEEFPKKKQMLPPIIIKKKGGSGTSKNRRTKKRGFRKRKTKKRIIKSSKKTKKYRTTT